MNFDELNAEAVHAAIINGCYRLMEQREELNRINVFPVADGDTGDNMSSVCAAIIEYSEIKEDVKTTLDSVAQVAIIGSRGNSGILFTHFFLGLHQHLEPCDKLKIDQLVFVFKKIAEEINSVLSDPVEGTIITLIKKLAQLSSLANETNSIAKTMSVITPQLKNEVERTATTLKQAQAENVVDAGALGFYFFIEGFSEFLVTGILQKLPAPHKIHSLQAHLHPSTDKPQHRYCTEAILKNSQVSPQELLQQLNHESDSLAAIGTKDLLKVHLHTNEPSHLFSTLYQLGTVKYPKVDDMQRQYEAQFAKKHSIALVTDSSADLPQELLDQYQIHTIALNIHIGDHDFLDKYSFEPNDFYKALQQMSVYPKTSCISPHQVKKFLNRLRVHYNHILILSISSAMSGMHSAFAEAAKEDPNITVLDTRTNSAAHGLLLDYSGKLIAKNLPFTEIIEKVKAAIKNTFIFVLVNQFESMIRSGRMSKISAKFAAWSHIKPLVSIDEHGRGVIAGKSFSSAKGLGKLIQLVQKQLISANALLSDYAIVHADNNEDAIHLAKMSASRFNKDPLFINPASLVIGLHAGKGCVAIAARIEPKQQGLLENEGDAT
ncbi:MAG: EDD domain protein [Legionella sp.]|nr:MAG: EDD domain protein [Legionella sp.]PJD99761.1 MAG: EDD domain protein [Legionella sp.]